MAPRKKDMLEAFRKVDGPGTEPASSAPAPAARSAGSEAGRSRREGVASLPALLASSSRGVLIGSAVILAFVLGYLLGRTGAGSEALAREPQEPASAAPEGRSGPASRPTAARGADPREGRGPAVGGASPAAREEPAAPPARIEESPLFDPANQFTVIVIAYQTSSEDLAWATYQHLKDSRLPVFPPVVSGKNLLVLVGAAPTSGELAQTERAVRELVRDGGKPYDSAYRARIDSILQRSR